APTPAAPVPAAATGPILTGTEIVFRPDPPVLDGRLLNNGWLQEMPKTLSKVTWDTVAYVDVRTAEKLRLANGDLVDVSSGGRSARIPAWGVRGMADGA